MSAHMLPTGPTNPAPTQTLIDDVWAQQRAGRIRAADAQELFEALRAGLIVCPIWEDYGLRTHPETGRPDGPLHRMRPVVPTCGPV